MLCGFWCKVWTSNVIKVVVEILLLLLLLTFNMCFLQIMVIIYNGTVGSFWILIQFLFILSVFSNTSFHSWDRCFRDSSSSSSAVASLPCSSFTSISDCLSTTKSTAGTGTGTWNTFIYGANAGKATIQKSEITSIA